MKDIKKNSTPDGSREAGFDRRRFIRTSVGAGAGLALSHSIGWADERADGPLPTRVLGRTGERVTILGLGTAPVGEGPPDVQEAMKVFEAAFDAGQLLECEGIRHETVAELIEIRTHLIPVIGRGRSRGTPQHGADRQHQRECSHRGNRAAGDLVENRPALSRWHPDYAEAFAEFMKGRRT